MTLPSKGRAKQQKVVVRPVQYRDRAGWEVDRQEGGRRRRTFYRTKKEAEAEAARLREELRSTGETWTMYPAARRYELISFDQECQRRGFDPWDLLRQIDAGELRSPTVSPILEKVIEELLKAKELGGRSGRYTQVLGIILRGFAKGRETLPIDRISVADVERWLNAKNLAGRATFRARLSTLFNFAIRRRYRTDNPCAALELPKITRADPRILNVTQVQHALDCLVKDDPRGLAWFVLSTFCGLRPEEAEQTTWSAIDIDNGEAHIRVDAQTSKKRLRRIVTPRPEAVELLKFARSLQSQLPLSRQERRLTIRKLRKALGFAEWPKDITRHTAASNWLAVNGDPMHVAEQLGHTIAELKGSYKALVTRADAERFWALRPVPSTVATTSPAESMERAA